MVGIKLTKKDFLSNRKSLNLVFSVVDIEKIMLVAEQRRIPVATLIKGVICDFADREADLIRKSKYVPLAQRGESLFSSMPTLKKRRK